MPGTTADPSRAQQLAVPLSHAPLPWKSRTSRFFLDSLVFVQYLQHSQAQVVIWGVPVNGMGFVWRADSHALKQFVYKIPFGVISDHHVILLPHGTGVELPFEKQWINDYISLKYVELVVWFFGSWPLTCLQTQYGHTRGYKIRARSSQSSIFLFKLSANPKYLD